MTKTRERDIGSTGDPWEFAGWGRATRIPNLPSAAIEGLDPPHEHMLGTWRATAICSNDITSSVLYVSALCAAQAGRCTTRTISGGSRRVLGDHRRG